LTLKEKTTSKSRRMTGSNTLSGHKRTFSEFSSHDEPSLDHGKQNGGKIRFLQKFNF
jgi:hypothetical protein